MPETRGSLNIGHELSAAAMRREKWLTRGAGRAWLTNRTRSASPPSAD
jgi:hypothetical protein